MAFADDRRAVGVHGEPHFGDVDGEEGPAVFTSVLHFGAGKGEKKPLEAHAWLNAAGVEVTGYPVPKSFAEIACFV